MAKWINISSNDFDRTVRRICEHNKRMRFTAGETGLYCFKCHNIIPLEVCSNCGGTEYDTDTYTGNIGLYCKKCKKGFDHFACTCGETSWIDSIHLRQKTPPSLIEKVAGAVIKIILLPITILKNTFKYLKMIKYPFVQMGLKLEESRINAQQNKKYYEDAFKWTEIYYQRNPGWIGSGFPLRAVYELKISAISGNRHALRSLELIFAIENDTGKKAETALALKEVTGKDYMTPDELKKGLAVSRAWTGPLPSQPDDLP